MVLTQKKRLQAGYFEHDEFGSKSIGVEVKLIDRQPYISSSTASTQQQEQQNDNEERSDCNDNNDNETIDSSASLASSVAKDNVDDGYENKYHLKIVNSLDVAEYKQLKKLQHEHAQNKEGSASAPASSLIQKITSSVKNIYSNNNTTPTSFQAGDFIDDDGQKSIIDDDNSSVNSSNSNTSSSSKKKSSRKKKIRRIKKIDINSLQENKDKNKLKKNRPSPPSYEEIESQLLQQALASGGVMDICYGNNNMPTKITAPHFDMRSWLASQYIAGQHQQQNQNSNKNSNLSSSYSLIVHEIRRGNWTWCLAWSPDGKRLALASENHHLAIVDTSSSAVWKIIHDKRISSHYDNNSKNSDDNNSMSSVIKNQQPLSSIRAIAWGHTYIAVGGTGDTVSILDPNTYLILHTIQNTGFVGSLHWKPQNNKILHLKNNHQTSTTLAIGTRNNLCLIFNVTFKENGGIYESKILHTVERKDWVNAVTFSPGGTMIAIADRSGRLSVYVYLDANTTTNNDTAADDGDDKKNDETKIRSSNDNNTTKLQLVKEFKFSGAVLAIEWSACGGFLYTGGENFKASFIKTNTWTIVHEIKRDQWVQFLTPSHTGLNVAIGGGKKELSIIDCGSNNNNGSTSQYIPVKNLYFDNDASVLLVSKWHPSDQYLAIGGQDSIVTVVETTNVRYVENSFLKLDNVGINCIQLSPTGTILVIARSDGVVTFMDTTASDSSSSFIVIYEIVLGIMLSSSSCITDNSTSNNNDSSTNTIDIEWSSDGTIVAIGSGDAVIVISTNPCRYLNNNAYKNSKLSLVKIIRGMRNVESISFSPGSNIMVVTGPVIKVFDAGAKFACIHDIKTHGLVLSSAWSHDGKLLAFIGKDKSLTIYSTATSVACHWKKIFEIKCQGVGTSLAWAPTFDADAGLKYLAYGGENKTVTIIEIRAIEESWEMVLEIPRKAYIYDLDWSSSGMLAIATSNGTATIVDLSYLLTGTSVIEMNYNWQRQGITCLTEIQRKQNKNKMRSLHWLGPKATDGNVLALAGSDGIFELIDMTERERIDEYFESFYYNDRFSCAKTKNVLPSSSSIASSLSPTANTPVTTPKNRNAASNVKEEQRERESSPGHRRTRSGSIHERMNLL